MSLLQWEAGEDGIKVSQTLDSSSPRVVANESDIRMIILNLVQNAFHAMPQGGKLSINTVKRGERIDILLQDTGIGIRVEDMQHIFDPFFSRRADGINGTGLGLSITKSLVERYGGSIRVESEPQRGSLFILSFPNPDHH